MACERVRNGSYSELRSTNELKCIVLVLHAASEEPEGSFYFRRRPAVSASTSGSDSSFPSLSTVELLQFENVAFCLQLLFQNRRVGIAANKLVSVGQQTQLGSLISVSRAGMGGELLTRSFTFASAAEHLHFHQLSPARPAAAFHLHTGPSVSLERPCSPPELLALVQTLQEKSILGC